MSTVTKPAAASAPAALAQMPPEILCGIARWVHGPSERATLRLTSRRLNAAVDMAHPKAAKKMAAYAIEACLAGGAPHPRLPELLRTARTLSLNIDGDAGMLQRAGSLLGLAVGLVDLTVIVEDGDVQHVPGPTQPPFIVALGQAIAKQPHLERVRLAGDALVNAASMAALAPYAGAWPPFADLQLRSAYVAAASPLLPLQPAIRELTLDDTVWFRKTEPSDTTALSVPQIVHMAQALPNLARIELDKAFSLAQGDALCRSPTIALRLSNLTLVQGALAAAPPRGLFVGLPSLGLSALHLTLGDLHDGLLPSLESFFAAASRLRLLDLHITPGAPATPESAKLLRSVGRLGPSLESLHLALEGCDAHMAALGDALGALAQVRQIDIRWRESLRGPSRRDACYVQALARLPLLGELNLSYQNAPELDAPDVTFWRSGTHFANVRAFDLSILGSAQGALGLNFVALAAHMRALTFVRLDAAIEGELTAAIWPQLQEASLSGPWTAAKIARFCACHTHLARLRLSQEPSQEQDRLFWDHFPWNFTEPPHQDVRLTRLHTRSALYLPEGLRFPELTTLVYDVPWYVARDPAEVIDRDDFERLFLHAPKLQHVHIVCEPGEDRHKIQGAYMAVYHDLAARHPNHAPIRFSFPAVFLGF